MTAASIHNAEAASIEIENLSFAYPGSRDPALSDIGFHIRGGERVGLLGPNGAGKTTLMRILCGYLPVPVARGKTRVEVAGLDVHRQSLAVRAKVGYLPEQVPLYPELRVREHLEFRAAVKGVARRLRGGEIRRVASLVGIADMLETPISRLSRGYRQRVGIADALLGSPPLVVLDEPTVGLDPNQVQGIRDALRALGGGQTLLFSSHMLLDVEALCDRILIFSQGRLVADERVHLARPSTLVVEWDGEVRAAAIRIVDRAAASIGRQLTRDDEPIVEAGRTSIVLHDPPGELAAAIGRASLREGVALVRLESGRRRLDERFARATGFSGGGSGGVLAGFSVEKGR